MRKLIRLLLAMLLIASSLPAAPAPALADHNPAKIDDPILFIPGTAGSVLKYQQGTEPSFAGLVFGEAWPDVPRAIFSGWVNMDPMRLKPDGKESAGKSQWYPTQPITWADVGILGQTKDIYGTLLETFFEKELHLRKKAEYDTFAYDWLRVQWTRDEKGNDRLTVDRLRDAIVALSNRNGGRDVVLVSHSLGGLIARDYIVKYKGDRVKAHIGMATPYQGTMLTYQTLRWGWNFGIPTVSPTSIYYLAGNWPVAYRLLPSDALVRDPFVWNPQDESLAWKRDEKGPAPKAVPYKLSDTWAAIRERNPKLYDEAATWRKSLLNGEDYFVRQINIVGTGKSTVSGFQSQPKPGVPAYLAPLAREEWSFIKTDEGDDTIPLASASLTDWKGNPIPAKEGIGHLEVRKVKLPLVCGQNLWKALIECSIKTGHTDLPGYRPVQDELLTLLKEIDVYAKPQIQVGYPYKLRVEPYWDGNTLRLNASIPIGDIGLPKDDLGHVASGTVTFDVFRPSCTSRGSLTKPYRSVQVKMPSGYWIQPTNVIGASAAIEIPPADDFDMPCPDLQGYDTPTHLFHVRATFQPRDGKRGGITLRYDPIRAVVSTTRMTRPEAHFQLYSDLNWVSDRGRVVETDKSGWYWAVTAPAIYTDQGAGKVRFSRSFHLPWRPDSASLGVTVDDKATVFVNGHKLADVSGFTNTTWVKVPLVAGANVIVVEVENLGGPAGFSADLRVSRGRVQPRFTVAHSQTKGHLDFEFLFVREESKEPVAGVDYVVTVDEKQAKGKTAADGLVSLTVPVKDAHSVGIQINGGDHYDAPDRSTVFRLSKPPIPEMTYLGAQTAGGALEASVRVSAPRGPQANVLLTATFRGKRYEASSGADGTARFRLEPPAAPGEYALQVNGSQGVMVMNPLLAWVTVKPVQGAAPQPVVTGAVTDGELRLLMRNGDRPVGGENITVSYEGVTATLKTDAAGMAVWRFTPPTSEAPVFVQVKHLPSTGYKAAEPVNIAVNGPQARYSEGSLPVEATARASVEGVSLSWSAFGTPHDGYYVFRGTKPGQYDAMPLTDFPLLGTAFADTTAQPGRTYHYVVRSYQTASGEYPAASKAVAVTMPSEVPAPTARVTGGKVELKWQPFGRPHDGYYIFRGTSPGTYDPVPLTDFPLLTESFTDAKAPKGQTLYYVIRTYRSDSGEYPASTREVKAQP